MWILFFTLSMKIAIPIIRAGNHAKYTWHPLHCDQVLWYCRCCIWCVLPNLCCHTCIDHLCQHCKQKANDPFLIFLVCTFQMYSGMHPVVKSRGFCNSLKICASKSGLESPRATSHLEQQYLSVPCILQTQTK